MNKQYRLLSPEGLKDWHQVQKLWLPDPSKAAHVSLDEFIKAAEVKPIQTDSVPPVSN